MCVHKNNGTELLAAGMVDRRRMENKIFRSVHIVLKRGVFVWCPLCRRKTQSTAHVCKVPFDGMWIDCSETGRNRRHRKLVQYRREIFNAFLRAPHLHVCYVVRHNQAASFDPERQVVYFGTNVVDVNHFAEIGKIEVVIEATSYLYDLFIT